MRSRLPEENAGWGAQPARANNPEERVIDIRNSGLVLTAPFLQHLWATLRLAQNNAYVDVAAAKRAAHLLQFVVSGDSANTVPVLALNEVLCGLTVGEAVDASIEITAQEKDEIETMLGALIAHWSVLCSTSVDGLRETFLQRPGSLVYGDRGWNLTVEPHAVDVLVDRLPWGIKIIKLPWMREMLFTEWR